MSRRSAALAALPVPTMSVMVSKRDNDRRNPYDEARVQAPDFNVLAHRHQESPQVDDSHGHGQRVGLGHDFRVGGSCRRPCRNRPDFCVCASRHDARQHLAHRLFHLAAALQGLGMLRGRRVPSRCRRAPSPPARRRERQQPHSCTHRRLLRLGYHGRSPIPCASRGRGAALEDGLALVLLAWSRSPRKHAWSWTFRAMRTAQPVRAQCATWFS